MGGVAPGGTGRATVHLKPGSYVMECGIYTSQGQVHRSLGMINSIVVTDAATGASPPEADVTIRLSGTKLMGPDTLSTGRKTVKFKVDQAPKEDSAYFAMLARLDSNATAQDLASCNLHVPPPTKYLGGFEYIPVSDSAYFNVDLTPGRYAWHWGYFGDALRGESLIV